MLLGAAKLLKQREQQLQGTVLLVFQPAEEGGAGADVMIKEGAIEGASAAYGFHVMPYWPTGQVALRTGTIMAGVGAQQWTLQSKVFLICRNSC
jgi:IAA-amino acid hydrolase